MVESGEAGVDTKKEEIAGKEARIKEILIYRDPSPAYLIQKLIALSLGPAAELAAVTNQLGQFSKGEGESTVIGQSLQKIIRQTLLLNDPASGYRMDLDHLMHLLATLASLDAGHQDLLGSHEGELLH